MHIEELKDWFKGNCVIGIKQIIDFYRTFEPTIKDSTANWRIHCLTQSGVINRVGRGKYSLGNKKNYIPGISKQLKTLNKKLKRQFPFLDCCLWSSALFNEFMHHQPGKFYLIVEVEKDATDSVFFFMKESKYSVFVEPTKELLTKYVPGEKETWIVKSLVTEAPIQEVSGIQTTTIEKMLVDLFCDVVILDAQQGAEKEQVFIEALRKYTINESRMLRYANRRRKKKDISDYIKKIPKYRQQ